MMPGQQAGLQLIRQDRARHSAYGGYVLARLVAADSRLWPAIERRMNELVVLAIRVIDETFQCYPVMPFGLTADDFLTHALGQFQQRIVGIERARGKSLAEIERVTRLALERGP